MSLAEEGTAQGRRRGKGERHLMLVGPGWNPHSVTQQFFEEGERQEALGWKNEKLSYADYDDEATVPDLDFCGGEAALPPSVKGNWTVRVATGVALVLSAVTFMMAWRMHAAPRSTGAGATQVEPIVSKPIGHTYEVVPIERPPTAVEPAPTARAGGVPRLAGVATATTATQSRAPASPAPASTSVTAASPVDQVAAQETIIGKNGAPIIVEDDDIQAPAVAGSRTTGAEGSRTTGAKRSAVTRPGHESGRPLRGFVWSPTEGRLVPSGPTASADPVPVQ